MFSIVADKWFAADCNLLQPTGSHSSHFPVFHSTHFNVARHIGSRWLSASRHRCCMRSVCADLSSTQHFALVTVSPIFLFLSSFSHSMWVGSGRSTLCSSANEEWHLADNNPLTGNEPKFIDNHHISKTTEIFIQEYSSDSRPTNLLDVEMNDFTFGGVLFSKLITWEGE